MAVCIVFTGESNSGGQALNTDASAGELDANAGVQILNVNTELFEDLDIGTNNNLDHFNLTPNTHGFELGLSNSVDLAHWESPVYLIQTGHGGSKISEWQTGGTYWTKFLARTAAAKAEFTTAEISPDYVVWMSFGINDRVAATNPSTWKTDTLEWINRIRLELPGAKIMMTILPSLNNTAFNLKILELANENNFIFAVETEGADMDDANHWSYEGMKEISNRLTHKSRVELGLDSGWQFTTFTASSHSGYALEFTGASPAGAITDLQYMPDGWAVEWAVSTNSDGVTVGLDPVRDTNFVWNSTLWNDASVDFYYTVSGTAYRASDGVPSENLGDAGFKMRLRRSGTSLIYETYDGVSWNTLHTNEGIFTFGSGYIKVVNASAGASDSIELLESNTTAPLEEFTLSDETIDAIATIVLQKITADADQLAARTNAATAATQATIAATQATASATDSAISAAEIVKIPRAITALTPGQVRRTNQFNETVDERLEEG